MRKVIEIEKIEKIKDMPHGFFLEKPITQGFLKLLSSINIEKSEKMTFKFFKNKKNWSAYIVVMEENEKKNEEMI